MDSEGMSNPKRITGVYTGPPTSLTNGAHITSGDTVSVDPVHDAHAAPFIAPAKVPVKPARTVKQQKKD